MKKVLCLFVSAMMIITLSTGCARLQLADDEPDTYGDQPDNPFEVDTGDEGLSSISHGFTNVEVDENKKTAFLRYTGGEVSLDYIVTASGTAKNVGFLVFVDGVPQPYKINTIEAPYEYMHIFELAEDNVALPFSFLLTPVAGKLGEVLNVHVVSVNNPTFIPNMSETSGYGSYHTILEGMRPMIFDADTSVLSPIQQYGHMANADISTELVTQAFLDTLDTGFGKVDMAALNKEVYSRLFIDGVDTKLISNLQVRNNGIIHVTLKIVGHPGITYKSTLYINHKPLSGTDGICFETTLTKGNISVIEADIDLETLEEFNTFYIISVPSNASDFPNDVVATMKTHSILLYK